MKVIENLEFIKGGVDIIDPDFMNNDDDLITAYYNINDEDISNLIPIDLSFMKDSISPSDILLQDDEEIVGIVGFIMIAKTDRQK